MIRLGDDGTMDTVLVCEECGEEFRFSRDVSFCEDYDVFVNECITEVDNDHECEE